MVTRADLDAAEAAHPNLLTAKLVEYRAMESVPACLLEDGKVSKQELRAWRGMPGSHHQIHVHHKKQWASNFYSPAEDVSEIRAVVDGARAQWVSPLRLSPRL